MTKINGRLNEDEDFLILGMFRLLGWVGKG